MERRQFTREFKLEAVRLIKDRGVSYVQASQDLGVHTSQLRDNAAMESFFSTLKTERTACKMYRTRDEARADVFDYIERFYNRLRYCNMKCWPNDVMGHQRRFGRFPGCPVYPHKRRKS